MYMISSYGFKDSEKSIFSENWKFCQKSKFWSKIEILSEITISSKILKKQMANFSPKTFCMVHMVKCYPKNWPANKNVRRFIVIKILNKTMWLYTRSKREYWIFCQKCQISTKGKYKKKLAKSFAPFILDGYLWENTVFIFILKVSKPD